MPRLDLIEKFWDALTPVQRAAAVAGASENKGCEEWIAARLPGCELGAAATCELACNAVLWNQGDLLASILSSSSDLTGEVTRYEGPGRRAGRFSETIAQLSSRCIDLVLEAALISKNSSAVRLALTHRFIIGKKDPGTLKRIDVSRREFFQIQKQFEFLTEKYGFCLSGSLTYSRQLSGKPLESHPEFYHMNHVRTGDSVGRPFRHRLPEQPRKKRHRL